jgi:hypothetical protein
MMNPGNQGNHLSDESAVANMIEYLMITGVIMVLLIVILMLVNTNIMEDPANRLVYVAFTDIGNGVSTRIVDVYSIAPVSGTLVTKFDIPDEIVGKDYFVEIGPGMSPGDQEVVVSRGYVESRIALAGIGASKAVGGNTTGRGVNIIRYNSGGFP